MRDPNTNGPGRRRATVGPVGALVAVVGLAGVSLVGFAVASAPPSRVAFGAAEIATATVLTGGGAPTPTRSPTPTPPPSPTQRPRAFISDQHRYVVMLPHGWTALPAGRPDSPDRFEGPGRRRLTIVAVKPPPSGFTDAWLDDRIPLRTNAAAACSRGSRSVPAPLLPSGRPARWTSTSIGDLDGRQRMYCGFVDAVAWSDGRAWILALGNPRSPTGDLAAFRELATTFRGLPPASTPTPRPTPHPPAPTPTATPTPTPDLRAFTETFSSERFHYAIRYPATWEVVPSGSSLMPDRFRSIGHTLAVSAWPLPEGTSLRDWAEERLPTRVKGTPTSPFCHLGNTMFPPDGADAFRDEPVAGRSAVVRLQCGWAEAVIPVGDRVVVLSLRALRPPRSGPPTRGRGTLEAFAMTLALPEDR